MFKMGRKGKNDIKSLDAYELIAENKSNSKFVILDVRFPR